MAQSKNNSVSFINSGKFSDTLGYDLSSNMVGNYDSQSLLPEAEGKGETHQIVKVFISGILKNHFKLFIVVCDAFCIFTFILFLLTKNVFICNNNSKDDIIDWCKPYEAVDKIIIDLNFDLLVHCDMPKSCVAYAEILMEKNGFNTNFIIGDEDLVYVGKGFQCKSDALRLQMLITRYTWDPKQPVYRIPEEVVVRYSEIIHEGLQCGKILPNFTVLAKCSVYGEWCGAPNIRDQVPWKRPAPLALAHEDRNPWYERPHGNHPFLAFDIERVYSRYYRLKACNRTQL